MRTKHRRSGFAIAKCLFNLILGTFIPESHGVLQSQEVSQPHAALQSHAALPSQGASQPHAALQLHAALQSHGVTQSLIDDILTQLSSIGDLNLISGKLSSRDPSNVLPDLSREGDGKIARWIKNQVGKCTNSHKDPFAVLNPWSRLQNGKRLEVRRSFATCALCGEDWNSMQVHRLIHHANGKKYTWIYHVSVEGPQMGTYKEELIDMNVRSHFAVKVLDLGAVLKDKYMVVEVLHELAVNMCEIPQGADSHPVPCIAESEHLNKMRYYMHMNWPSSSADSTKADEENHSAARAALMFYDLAAGTMVDVAVHIGQKYMDEAILCKYTKHMVQAVAALHADGVLHRDLKLENFLVNIHNGELELTDYDMSKEMELNGRTKSAIPIEQFRTYYLAPEVENPGEEGYGVESEIWSIGWAVYMLRCWNPPLNYDEPESYEKWKRGQSCFEIPVECPENKPALSPNLRNFLEKAFTLDRAERRKKFFKGDLTLDRVKRMEFRDAILQDDFFKEHHVDQDPWRPCVPQMELISLDDGTTSMHIEGCCMNGIFYSKGQKYPRTNPRNQCAKSP